uniref:Uncharacterized protein n=1 Tax=Avena sativa TaxID=4498 RepID=A0ACD5WRT6_AVESA
MPLPPNFSTPFQGSSPSLLLLRYLPARTLMGQHAYDNGGMSPSTPPAVQHRGSSRPHATVTSRTSTTRPAIKIIHILAPEIIKTDAANFRDLVQRLTGRQQPQPANDDDDESKAVTVTVAPTPSSPVEEKPQKKRLPALADDFVVQQENRRKKKIKCEVKVEEGWFGGSDLDFGELWMDLNPGGFLTFLEEEVFQGMAPDSLQPPLRSSRMDLIGEMCASFLA